MKRKSFVSILIVLLALFSLTRCKLAEVETIDEIPCPGVGIDTVIIPGWDNQPDDQNKCPAFQGWTFVI